MSRIKFDISKENCFILLQYVRKVVKYVWFEFSDIEKTQI